MTPIESPYDIRLVTLLSVAMDALGSLALCQEIDSTILLAEALYRSNRRVNEIGEEAVLNTLLNTYPLLAEAVTELNSLQVPE